ncbi:prepilin-type N-terminal cleavage/methylation domain-containing protein [Halioglobus maricola]|uniref:Type II secretion system protein H n=1 Tax=Halioglobus maricola TaxID=2601894 RepID=A0A5P9NNC6_9GAMM|nr:GspH/FimT family pseudopilin [Halioglobus maricola]QFU76996.1 prepilin-type N-terminal cleavage/methylation domain-containing protein [Halioglobus maricola]
MLELQRQKNTPTAARSEGFTLIELMVVLAVLAALLLVAAPGLADLIRNNQMVTDVYALRATLNNARSEAITRRAPVVVCPSSDGATCLASNDWSNGYITFVAMNNNTAPDPNDPDEELIQWEPRDRAMNIFYSNSEQQVIFNARGTALDYEGTFEFCDERGTEDARALILNPVGSVSSATDTDTNGIVNDHGGADVTCS